MDDGEIVMIVNGRDDAKKIHNSQTIQRKYMTARYIIQRKCWIHNKKRVYDSQSDNAKKINE